jgi:hypothetical protein
MLPSLCRLKTTALKFFPHGKQKNFREFRIASHQLPGVNIFPIRMGWQF